MSEENKNATSAADRFLDLLLDAMEERRTARPQEPTAAPKPTAASTSTPTPAPASSEPTPSPAHRAYTPPPTPRVKRAAQPGDPDWELPPRAPSIQMDVMIKRLALMVVGLIILFNIPINQHGISLARIMPDRAALIIRDGLVLKGEGTDIYVLEDNKLRWISSLDAFQYKGYRWSDVHEVDDDFLADFEMGEPIHVLFKCHSSPHIYRIENGQKRWIKDIATFVAEGHVWEDVVMVDCQYLRTIPNGPPIPEDAGPSPAP